MKKSKFTKSPIVAILKEADAWPQNDEGSSWQTKRKPSDRPTNERRRDACGAI